MDITFGYIDAIGLSGAIIPALPADAEGKRSGHWPTFLHELLAKHPICIGCNRRAMTGHHIKPFHLFPDLELVESNIAPVCIPCHFVICHAGDWRLYVEDPLPLLEAHNKIVVKAKNEKYHVSGEVQ